MVEKFPELERENFFRWGKLTVNATWEIKIYPHVDISRERKLLNPTRGDKLPKKNSSLVDSSFFINKRNSSKCCGKIIVNVEFYAFKTKC